MIASASRLPLLTPDSVENNALRLLYREANKHRGVVAG